MAKTRSKSKKDNRWIQRAIEHPGRCRRYLKRLYGDEAFTKDGHIKITYVDKAIKHVKENVKDKERRRSLLSMLNLCKRLIKMRR